MAAYINYYNVPLEKTHKGVGWLLAAAVVIIAFLNVLFLHHCTLGCQRIGMRVRVACCSLVYRKVSRAFMLLFGK